jgi:hypothetical protein
MLSAIVVAVALLCSAHAYDECQQEFDETTSLSFDQRSLDEIEGSAKPCCLPQQLTGGISLKTIIRPRRRAGDDNVNAGFEGIDAGFGQRPRHKPIGVLAQGCFAVDYSKGKIRVNEQGVVSDKSRFNFSVIQDKKSLYIVDWQKKVCVIRPASNPLNQCISPNATLLAQPTFGLKDAGLKVNIYGQKFSTQDSCGGALVLVTSNKCAPFVIDSEVFTRDSITLSSMSYYDQQASIKDASVFNPPAYCRKTTEVGYDFIDEELPTLIKHFVQMANF